MSAKVLTLNPEARVQRSTIRIWRQLMMALIAGALVAQSVGCSVPAGGPMGAQVFDHSLNSYRNHVWASRAYNLRYGSCERKYGNHFRSGFIKGYCSVCNGDSGYVPAMPPENYWESKYQCPEGANCVNAWFEGYPAGAQAAQKDGAGSFHDIYISKMVNSAIVQENDAKKIKRSTSVPVVEPASAPRNFPQAMVPPIVPSTNAPATTGPTVVDMTIDANSPMSINGIKPASYDAKMLEPQK